MQLYEMEDARFCDVWHTFVRYITLVEFIAGVTLAIAIKCSEFAGSNVAVLQLSMLYQRG